MVDDLAAERVSFIGVRGRLVQCGLDWARARLIDNDRCRLLDFYDAGQFKLDELITREYPPEDINQGYDDMLAGVNLRGLIRY